jgi:hypothetical protein
MNKKVSFNEKYSIKTVSISKPSHPWKPSSSPISAWNIIRSSSKKRPLEETPAPTPKIISPKITAVPAPVLPPPPPAPKKPKVPEYIQRCHPIVHPESNKQKHCSICLGNFANLESLNIHCARTHFNLYGDFYEAEFRECYFCCLRFTFEDTEAEYEENKNNPDEICFAMHVLKHQGATPFECLLCKQTFTQKRILSSHYRQAHKIERPIFHAATFDGKFKPISFIAGEQPPEEIDEQ